MTWFDTSLVLIIILFLAFLIWRQVTKQNLRETVHEIKEAISEIKEP